jgi:hypothetical protein
VGQDAGCILQNCGRRCVEHALQQGEESTLPGVQADAQLVGMGCMLILLHGLQIVHIGYKKDDIKYAKKGCFALFGCPNPKV